MGTTISSKKISPNMNTPVYGRFVSSALRPGFMRR